MMNSKLLLGFTFANSNQVQRVNGFRLRFDNKYFSQPNLVMSLMSPFTIDAKDEDKLISEMSDELESFFFGHEDNLALRFSKLDVFSYAKNHVLNLTPDLQFDLEHCTESLRALAREYIYDKDIKNKIHVSKVFLPLARFKEHSQLEMAVSQARREFELPIDLPLSSISLFKKRGHHWYEKSALISFSDATNSFLHSDVS